MHTGQRDTAGHTSHIVIILYDIYYMGSRARHLLKDTVPLQLDTIHGCQSKRRWILHKPTVYDSLCSIALFLENLSLIICESGSDPIVVLKKITVFLATLKSQAQNKVIVLIFIQFEQRTTTGRRDRQLSLCLHNFENIHLRSRHNNIWNKTKKPQLLTKICRNKQATTYHHKPNE